MPGVYHYLDKDFLPLFDELATTDNYEYFTPAAVKHLIEFNFPLVRKYIVIKLFIPFICFIGFYSYFTHYVYPERLNENYKIELWISIILLPLFALYFLHNEFKQVIEDGFSYFSSMWNYIDIIPSIGTITSMVFIVVEILTTSTA
jgi:hypothetical protein